MDPALGTALVLASLLLGSVFYQLSRKKPHDSPWKILATKDKGLRFQPASPPYTEANIIGEYRDCHLELHSIDGSTFLDVVPLHPVGNTSIEHLKKTLGEVARVAEVENAFHQVASHKLKGVFEIEPNGQSFRYEQDTLEEDIHYLQALFELFTDLVMLYPKVLILGGEAVPLLTAVAQDDAHLLQTIAHQWLHQIARETRNRVSSRADTLICPRCVIRAAAHGVEPGAWQKIIYYGCRTCHQSQEFIEVQGDIIAVLDHQMTNKQFLHEDNLRVNILAWPTLFDFDRIEIGQTSDEEVERFAVRAANNADLIQQARLKEISCWVSPNAGLSENTLRVLQRIFGQVEIQPEE